MAKNYSVSFDIRGSLDGSLLSAIQSAQNALKGLNQTARAASNAAKFNGLAGMSQSLNAIQQAANKFRELKKASVETQQALANAQKQAQQLGREYSQSHQKQIQELDKQKNALKDLKTAQAAANKSLEQYRAGWRHFRDERAIIKYKLHELGAKGRKIPRELLGTAQGKEIGRLLTQLNENKKALETQRQQFRAAREEAQKYAKQIRETQNAIKNQERLAAQGAQDFNAARAKAQNLKASLQQQLEALQRLRSQLGAAGFNTSHFAASERALQSEIDRVNQSLQRQQQLLQARQNFNAAAGNLGLASAGMMGAVYTAQQVAEPFKSAAENAMTFEKAMSRLKALTQMRNLRAGNMAAVEREMASMTETIERLGATSELTANQIAGAANYYAMSGWTPEQINAMLPTTTNLASIAQIPIDRAADMLSDDMTAFGIKAGQSYKLAGGKLVDGAQYFGDAVAYATTQANMDFSTFHEAWKYNAPTAHAMNLTLGEAIAQNMVAANAGIKGSMAGTSFRQFWVRLSAPPKTAQKSMEEMGMTASDATKTIREMQEAMAEAGVDQSSDLFAKIEALEQYYQSGLKAGRDMTGWLKGLTGQTALSGVQSLFDTGKIDEAKRYAHEIDSGFIEGWATDTAAVMRDNTQTAIDYLTSAADALQRSAGKALLPAIRSVAEAFTPLITSAAQWVAQNPAIVQACAAIATSLSGIIISAAAVKLAFAGWGFITSAITLVRTALAGLGSGAMLGGLIGRIAALRTALFGLGGAATLGGWSAMFTAIATSARTATTAVTRFFASLSVSSMASGAIAALRSVGTAILGAARAAMMFAFSPVGVALMALALAGIYCYQNWDRVAPVLSMIADIVTGALAPAFNQIKAAIEGFASSGGFAALQSIVTSLANAVGGKLVNAFLVLLSVAASVIAGLIQLFADLITIVIDFGTGISEAFAKIKSGEVMGALDALQSAGKKVSDDIFKLGEHTFDSFIQGAKNVENVLSVLDMPKLPTQEVTARHRVEFNESGQAHESTSIDTTTTQAALDAVGESAQNAATNMDGVQQATDAISQIPASIQPTTDALSQIPAQIQPAADGLNQMGTTLPTTVTEAQNLATAMQGATEAATAHGDALLMSLDAIMTHGAACSDACGNINNLGEAAGGAADLVAGLGEAARSACAQLAAAGANAAAQVSAAASSIKVGHNAEGGIYQRGAFLTTFAEKSPEAAIPLDGSKRAQSLWRTAGQMLGILPQTDGRRPNWSIKRMPRLGGLKMPRINFPTMTPPTFPEERPIPRLSIPQGGGDLPPINVTIHVTINGNADEQVVRRGLESAMPSLRRSFAEELAAYRREQRRRSFA